MCELNSGSPVCSKCCSPSVEQAVDPAQLGFGAVIGVQDDAGRRTPRRACGRAAPRPRTRGSTPGRPDTGIALAGDERRTAVENWMITGAVELGRGLHHRVHRVRPDAVGGGNRELFGLRERKQLGHGIAGEDTGREVISEVGHVRECRSSATRGSETTGAGPRSCTPGTVRQWDRIWETTRDESCGPSWWMASRRSRSTRSRTATRCRASSSPSCTRGSTLPRSKTPGPSCSPTAARRSAPAPTSRSAPTSPPTPARSSARSNV